MVEATVEDAKILEARAKLREKMGADVSRLGGKGSVRRKKRVVHKAAGGDDKQMAAALKRLNVTTIPGIEEVTMFRNDMSAIHFQGPKIQASPNANTYVVGGKGQEKKSEDILQNLMPFLGQNNISPEKFKAMMEQATQSSHAAAGDAAGAEDDDDIPDLVENFDQVE